MPEWKNLCSGSNNRSRSLNLGTLLSFGPFRSGVLQRANRMHRGNHGRIFVNFGRSMNFGLGFGLEEVTDTGGETTANFQGFDIRLWWDGCLLCLFNFFNGRDISSRSGLTLKKINLSHKD